jgi:hypothetical protein
MSEDDISTSAPVDAAQTSSPASTPASASPAESAPSPSAAEQTTGETHQSLLEAVQEAVPSLRQEQGEAIGGEGASPASTAKDRTASPDDVDDDGALPDEITSEEMAKYAQSAKRRIKKLAKQRHELRGEVERLRGIEPSAKAADSVSSYLRENDIGREDFLHGLELMSAVRRGDFQTFYAGIQPYVKLAEEYLGVSLPADLQQAVRQGQMTTEAASRFSRERMDRAIAQSTQHRVQQQAAAQQQHFQQQAAVQQREHLANSVRDRVNAWEQTVIQHDPDYAAKRAAVQDTMWAVVRETGVPQSPEHAVSIAREAYKRVNERYRSWAPPKRPTSRGPSSTGRTTGAAPEAKSLLDVVRHARESARA